jgi:hypothetical protein
VVLVVSRRRQGRTGDPIDQPADLGLFSLVRVEPLALGPPEVRLVPPPLTDDRDNPGCELALFTRAVVDPADPVPFTD